MKKTFLFVFSALVCRWATAATGYYLVSAYDVEGQLSIDYKYWNAKVPGSAPVGAPDIGIGYGVTSRWYTELYASYIQTSARGTSYSGLNWQNDYLLTQGQYPFDLAIHTNVEQYQGSRSGYGLEVGPVLQTEIGRTQFNANVFLQRDYGTGQSAPVQMVYQWQVKHRWKPLLEFGVQGFGELGQWDHWDSADRQSHRIGPMLAGTWYLGKNSGNTQQVKYETAYLVGKNGGRSAKSFTMRLQYAF